MKIKIKNFVLMNYYDIGEKRDFEFRAVFKIGLKDYLWHFRTMNNTEYLICFVVSSWANDCPKDEKLQEKVLAKAYGELQRIIGENKVEIMFEERRRKKEEEEREKREAEERKRIALGEQISIEKYLLNK